MISPYQIVKKKKKNLVKKKMIIKPAVPIAAARVKKRLPFQKVVKKREVIDIEIIIKKKMMLL